MSALVMATIKLSDLEYNLILVVLVSLKLCFQPSCVLDLREPQVAVSHMPFPFCNCQSKFCILCLKI